MRRGPLLVLALVLALIAGTSTVATSTAQDRPRSGSGINGKEAECPTPFTAAEFRSWSAKVWDADLWERGMPSKAVLAAQRHKLYCAAGPGHRGSMRRTWKSDKTDFFHYRGKMMWITHVTPYYGCTKLGICKWWALPAYIVSCESGGDYTPDSGLTFGGAYGLLVSTWLQFGGGKYASQANYATPKQQDLIAHKVWNAVGPSAWACA